MFRHARVRFINARFRPSKFPKPQKPERGCKKRNDGPTKQERVYKREERRPPKLRNEGTFAKTALFTKPPSCFLSIVVSNFASACSMCRPSLDIERRKSMRHFPRLGRVFRPPCLDKLSLESCSRGLSAIVDLNEWRMFCPLP